MGDSAPASTACADIGGVVVKGLLKDASFQKPMKELINNAVGTLVDDVLWENDALRADVKKYKGETSAAKGKVAALEAKNARLKARWSPSALKAAAIRLFDKVLVSGTFGNSFSNLALLANKAYGHKIFKSIRKSLSPTDRSHYAKFFKDPGARHAFEETLYNFCRGGLESLKPSILDFLETHADFPSAAEIDACADDVDTDLLGDFVFVESEEDEEDEEEDEEERGDDERQEKGEKEMETDERQPLVQAADEAANNEELDQNAEQDV